MIFVAVGTQLAFDRLIRTVDEWAGITGHHDIIAQVGPAKYSAQHIVTHPFVTPQQFRDYVEKSDFVVAHAGMGTIITALELGKPVLVMPRRAELGEHRNDHQIATARKFQAQGRVKVAFDERELLQMLGTLERAALGERAAPTASPELIDAIALFIAGSGGGHVLRHASHGEAEPPNL